MHNVRQRLVELFSSRPSLLSCIAILLNVYYLDLITLAPIVQEQAIKEHTLTLRIRVILVKSIKEKKIYIFIHILLLEGHLLKIIEKTGNWKWVIGETTVEKKQKLLKKKTQRKNHQIHYEDVGKEKR